MQANTIQTHLIRLSGGLVLMIGAAHFFMPTLGYSDDIITVVPEVQREHFVYLGTYAIGLFLIGFGVLTFAISGQSQRQVKLTFFGVMALIWFGRLILEFLYPVHVSLFLLSDPHIPLVCAITLILAGYVAGFIGALRDTSA